MWVHTSSDLAACETALRTCTCHHWRPACQAYIKHNDFFLARSIRCCTSSALEGSHASSFSCSEEMLFAHNFCRVFLPGGEEATDVSQATTAGSAFSCPLFRVDFSQNTHMPKHTYTLCLSVSHTHTHTCLCRAAWVA